jgi:predicted porin
MKKSLVALAALAVAGIASAQSSVTLFGVVDATINYASNKTTTVGVSSTSKGWSLGNSGYNSSRIGFRGTEDLGGGMAASFWLEGGVSNDNGSQGGTVVSSGTSTMSGMFNRRSTVSLSGNFGEVRLGRDYTPTFWNDTVFDPFGTNGVGTNLISSARLSGDVNYVRASNSIGYFLPSNIGGVYGQVMYAMPESTSTNTTSASKAGRYMGGRIGYAQGPLNIAAAYAQSTISDVANVVTKQTPFNLGASYNLGVANLMAEYASNKQSVSGSSTSKKSSGFLFGATAPLGAGEVRAAFSTVKMDGASSTKDDKGNKFALGYVHNLSKRTALYSTVAFTNMKSYSSANVETKNRSTGFDFGVRHAF